MFSLIDRLLSFCASLRLAVMVIVLLAVYLAVGTLYESRYGARAAQVMVYGSVSFVVVMALLALNVFSAAVVRFPWKRHQTGFVVTHLGIEVLLLGCLIGSARGFEGQQMLRVGETAEAIDLSAEQIVVVPDGDRDRAGAVPLETHRLAGYPSLGGFVMWNLWRPGEELRATPGALGDVDGVRVELLDWKPAVRTSAGYEARIGSRAELATTRGAPQRTPAADQPGAGGLQAARVRVSGKVPNGATVDQTHWVTSTEPVDLFGGTIRIAFVEPGPTTRPWARGEYLISRDPRGGWQGTIVGVNGVKSSDIIELGRPVLAWMGLSVTVERVVENAVRFESVEPIRVPVERIDTAVAGARVALTVEGERAESWVLRGEAVKSVPVGGRAIGVGYTFARRAIPFQIELNRVGGAGGVDASTVPSAMITVREGGATTEQQIAPNAPGKAAGMAIYLSAVERVDGEAVAFVRVRYDPGWIVKYCGSALVVLGTVMMFVFRKPRTETIVIETEAAQPQTETGNEPGARRPARVSALIAVALLWVGLCPVESRAQTDVDALRTLPVYHAERVKPLDTMAREIVRQVTGGESGDCLLQLLRWSVQPDVAAGDDVLLVQNLDLRARLGMSGEGKFVSRKRVLDDTQFMQWVGELRQREREAAEHGQTLAAGKEEAAALELMGRVGALEAVMDGSVFRIVPSSSGEWRTPGEASLHPLSSEWEKVLSAVGQGRALPGMGELPTIAGALSQPRLKREVAYNASHPFRWTGLGYAAGLLVLIGGTMSGSRAVRLGGCAIVVSSLLAHAGAFVWRSSVTGWAPVTNMYETVIWVGGVAAGLGLVLSSFGHAAAPAIGGTVVAALGCVVGDVMPPEYGKSIQSLAAPLRSNLWLTVHVLTVVSSYAAFALAAVLGNVALLKANAEVGMRNDESGTSGLKPARHESSDLRPPTSSLLLSIYRCIQIGVVLIAAGTVLGALWADVSWGRFWGWDPKEVWALVVLLSYLALLHARSAGYVRGQGFAAWTVVCFMTVLMSWYGVNFVLGTGLHSYGFGTGGAGYVLSYVAAQLGFVIWASWRYRKRAKGTRHELAASAGSTELQKVMSDV